MELVLALSLALVRPHLEYWSSSGLCTTSTWSYWRKSSCPSCGTSPAAGTQIQGCLWLRCGSSSLRSFQLLHHGHESSIVLLPLLAPSPLLFPPLYPPPPRPLPPHGSLLIKRIRKGFNKKRGQTALAGWINQQLFMYDLPCVTPLPLFFHTLVPPRTTWVYPFSPKHLIISPSIAKCSSSASQNLSPTGGSPDSVSFCLN